MKQPVHEADVPWDLWYARTDREIRGRALSDVPERAKIGFGVLELSPGADTRPAHYHTHEEEHLYTLGGAATLHLGDATFSLTRGSYVCFPAGQPHAHYLANTGTVPFTYVMVGERIDVDQVVYPDAAPSGCDQSAVTPILTGGCLCGAVRFACHAAASLVSYCHCRMCQKATGAPFSVMANFAKTAVRWEGEPTRRRSSPLAVRGFCGDCGTPLCFEYDDSDHVSLAVGAFDEPSGLRPSQHGGIEGRIAWISIDPHLPGERCDDDSDYRALRERFQWRPPFDET